VFGGFWAWLGLLNARLHPALALVVIVPFMPGPEAHALEAAEEKQKAALKEQVLTNVGHGASSAGVTAEQAEWMKDASKAAIEKTATSGSSITAAYNKKLLGAKKDDSLKIAVVDEEGEEHHVHSTLDQFEHDIHVWVDFGMFLFSFCNAGVQITGIGALTWIIFISLVFGKYCGIFAMYKLSCLMRCPAPLGVRAHHVRMIGFIAGIGLTVALFVADAAYVEPVLKGDAKLGSLLSGTAGFAAIIVGNVFNYKTFDLVADSTEQIQKIVMKEVDQGGAAKPPPPGSAAELMSRSNAAPSPMFDTDPKTERHVGMA